jgi:hypothetical protein
MRLPFMATVLSILLAPLAARAWTADGHRFVCIVASYEMSEAARAKVKSILGVSTREDFAEACVAPEAEEFPLYVPLNAREINPARDCAAGCALTVIADAVTALQAEGPQKQKAVALRRLMAAVADIHHPLNTGFSHDRGGRDVTAIFNGKPTTLRAIWDDGLLGARPEPWREIADSYAQRFPYVERRTWPHSAPLTWANESLYILRTPATGYLGNPGGLAFDSLYVRQNQLTAIRRLSQAGVRLARVMNELWTQ